MYEALLSEGQFKLVYNVFSLVIATMFASGLFFYGSRTSVNPKYRPALLVSALVVFIAGYHYFRIFESWSGNFTLTADGYQGNGSFNDAYRYADWLITVPLLLVELVAVLALAKAQSISLLRKLVIAAVAMLVFGYIGETEMGNVWVFFTLSMLPFLYILKVLYSELGEAASKQPAQVASLIGWARTVIVISWWVYPIAYVAGFAGLLGTGGAAVALNVTYAIADLFAKAYYGTVIYQIARAKTEIEGSPTSLPAETAAV